MRLRIAAISVAFITLVAGALPAAAAPGEFHAPRHFYLALGDSLAYGFQPNGVFNAGYVDDLSGRLGTVRPITTVNYGCPGETTSSFTALHCTSSLQPHDNYSGDQLDAALAFLAAHQGQVSPITLDLGGNDLDDALLSCLGALDIAACIGARLPTVLQGVATNLDQILRQLRGAAPRSEILVLLYYNPFAVIPSLAAPTDLVVEDLNATIAQVAAAHGARLADAFTPFNVTPPPGGLCPLVWLCTVFPDIHPTTAGYQEIADQFWAASGYGGLD